MDLRFSVGRYHIADFRRESHKYLQPVVFKTLPGYSDISYQFIPHRCCWDAEMRGYRHIKPKEKL